MILELFKPPQFNPAPLNIEDIRNRMGRVFTYVSSGKAAIYHILRSFKVCDRILIPAYICPSVLVPLKRLGISPLFYDINQEDLNADLESIKIMVKKHKVRTVLVASLYGNPADLIAIENYCRENDLLMIDDAAQSCGATLKGRYVGTFGDAGFFSFSPGKATAGHMGGYFWTNNSNYKFPGVKHDLIHLFYYWDYYFNRLNIYKYKRYGIFMLLNKIKRIISKCADLYYDQLAEFEKPILGGILRAVCEGEYSFREKYNNEFKKRFSDQDKFKVVNALRGIPHNHKIVIIMNNCRTVGSFIKYMKKNGISALNGYKPLTDDLADLPNTREIAGRVVEMPIEDDENKMSYLFQKVGEYVNGNIN